MPNLFDWSPEAWSAAADWMVAFSAIGASYAAVRGINAWRRQEEWKTDAELSRKILISISKYQDAVFDLCRPIPWKEKMRFGLDDGEWRKVVEAEQIGLHKVLSRKWEAYAEIYSELMTFLVEAGAIWPAETEKVRTRIGEFHNEISEYMGLFLHAETAEDDKTRDHAKQELTQKRRVLDAEFIEMEDFGRDLVDTVGTLRKILQKKLGRAKA